MPKGARKPGTLSPTAKWLIGLLIPIMGGLVTLLVSHSLQVTDEVRHARATGSAETRRTLLAASLSPTAVQSPTATITHTSTATHTPAPTPTGTPTPTLQVNGLEFCITVGSVNVRTGPGMEYPVIKALYLSNCLYFDGSNADGTWYRVSSGQPDYPGLENNWVNAAYLTRGDDQKPPVVPVPPTPYPTFTPAG